MLPKAKEIVDAASLKMQDSVEYLEEDLKNYRVGKASPSIFNPVMVDYYGTPTPLNQVASITTPDAGGDGLSRRNGQADDGISYRELHGLQVLYALSVGHRHPWDIQALQQLSHRRNLCPEP